MYCNDKNCTHRLCKFHWHNAKGEYKNHLIYMQDNKDCRKKEKNKVGGKNAKSKNN